MPFAEPRPGLLEAGVDGDLRLPFQVALGARRVQARAPHLELASREELGLRVAARLFEQPLDDGVHADLAPAADVHLAGSAAEHRGHIRSPDVSQVHQIARLPAVAVDTWSGAIQKAVAGDGDDARLAGAVLARAEHVAIPQRERRDPVAQSQT